MGTDIHAVWQKKTDAGWEDVTSKWDQYRHYMLFAWLGNVRNGYGFAGIPTHNAIHFLSSKRGFPEDFVLDDEIQEFHNGAWMGDHSHSWLSSDEILKAAENLGQTLRTGVVDRETFDQWDGESEPEDYCGGVFGHNIKVSSPSDLDETTTHVQVEWFDSLADNFQYFLDEVKRLVAEHGELRLVFGFDS